MTRRSVQLSGLSEREAVVLEALFTNHAIRLPKTAADATHGLVSMVVRDDGLPPSTATGRGDHPPGAPMPGGWLEAAVLKAIASELRGGDPEGLLLAELLGMLSEHVTGSDAGAAGTLRRLLAELASLREMAAGTHPSGVEIGGDG